ncbi:HK97-gp10 family putative phage morphogenesis protein [Paraburkholderia sacchari]|uniref:HK97-gp10 family putative phage morphogenesis protein n=1 Tax=Paraburkholderia sacchari TaxID=159450 RepID=UPI001BCF818B|nr:HK97-gp10 family putative phage morphogenesis protein [Paraburkholderia sacchari]
MQWNNPDAITGFLKRLDSVASEQTLRRATVAGARVLHAEVKLRAPVGTAYERKGTKHEPGTLRNSILIAYAKEDSVAGQIATYLVKWSNEAFYGYFVEYGTARMAAEPFLRPAYHAKRNEAVAAMRQVVEQAFEEAARGG